MTIKNVISLCILLLYLISASAQGACSSAINLTLNGTMNNYATSSSTGGSVVCSAYATTSPVTWFSFTTSSVTQCPLLNILASDGASCEIGFYTDCGGNMNNNLDATSSMCFDDGEGLWAPAESFPLQANHTYYLRIKTSSACTISIGGQYYSPSNSNCTGAATITTSAYADNNSCHKPSGEVTPGQLCAFSLENTAFYKFYVASTGSAIINVSSIACDNGNGNNSSGFQIGFFSGSCGALVPINCTSGSGAFVQATTNPLAAGSLVYVAIDGVAGSNCQYSLSGINVWGALSTNFKNFSAWKTSSGNNLKWTCFNDTSAYYIIERSGDGTHFTAIGQVKHPYIYNQSTEYNFQDEHPLKTSFYRVKQVDKNGTISMSHIITVVRKEFQQMKITMQNLVNNSLHVQIESGINENMHYAIVNNYGQCFLSGTILCNRGITQFYKDIGIMPAGKYILILKSGEEQATKNFIKMN